MYKDKKVLALIPARGGSKSVPQKNIRQLAGRPLIFYAIDAAKKAKLVDRLIVSTDDKDIARIAEELGAEVPFLRPAELARDDTADWPVFDHAISFTEDKLKWRHEVIVHLRATSPFVRAEDIDAGIKKLIDTDADGVRAVNCVKEMPYHMQVMSKDGRIKPLIKNIYARRQDSPPVYITNGIVDVAWRKTILEEKKIFNLSKDIRGLEIEQYRGLDLDSESDFLIAEEIMSHESEFKKES